MYKFDRNEYERRMKWFLDARFGMFIHWGLYAIPARGEWVRSTEQMEEAGYMRYFYEFDPRLYDPSTWVRAARHICAAALCILVIRSNAVNIPLQAVAAAL